ncbi:somatoliberin isoform X2 [Solea solea]|uniref:somatoliberin isoform X2 n=1 Tax=Solea solea TaxID=90069 RepID=UPI002729E1CA|nr:somatoliberin isoform X2 [Solea solea]
MMDKAALLLFCCLVMSLSGSPLYPSIRFGQRDTCILMTSSINDPAEKLQDDTSPPRERAELRYRKVLGQISARKFLQTIMGKRLGDESESYMKRQSDIYEGTYKEDLTSIQSNHRYRGVHGEVMGPRFSSSQTAELRTESCCQCSPPPVIISAPFPTLLLIQLFKK